MNDGPAPGNGNQHGRDDSFSDIFEDEVQDLEDVDACSVAPEEKQVYEPIQIGSADEQQPSIDHEFDCVGVGHREQVGERDCEVDDHA